MLVIMPKMLRQITRSILIRQNDYLRELQPLNLVAIRLAPTIQLRPLSASTVCYSKQQTNGNQSDLTSKDRTILTGTKELDKDLDMALDETNEDNIFLREFQDIKLEDFESIYNHDKTGETKELINTVLQEYEYEKYNSLGKVPTTITVVDMTRCLKECDNSRKRLKFFYYLYTRDLAKRRNIRKKEEEKAERKIRRQSMLQELSEDLNVRTGLLSPSGKLIYGLWHNSLVPRIHDNKIKSSDSERKLVTSALFGRKIIFDFDFESQMPPHLSRNAAEQVIEGYGLNKRSYEEPFDIWFCNFKTEDEGPKFCVNHLIPERFERSMITVKRDCFTKYFNKKNLVYLTPNSPYVIDGDIAKNDDIYIIGALNDKVGARPITYRKAEALGIRSMSLPIDRYLAWHAGAKSLCLNHVLGIVLEALHNGGDWKAALLKYVPDRKLKKLDVILREESIRRSKKNGQKKAIFDLRADFMDD